MSFFSEYAAARQAQQAIGENERAMARTRLADTAASNARMEALKKADADRRFAAQGLPEAYSTSGVLEPGQAGPAPGAQGAASAQPGTMGAYKPRTGMGETTVDEYPAERERLARAAPPSSADTYTQTIARMKAARAAGKPFDPQDVALVSRGPAGGATTAGETPSVMYGSRLEELNRLSAMGNNESEARARAGGAADQAAAQLQRGTAKAPSQYDKPTPYDPIIAQAAQQYGVDAQVLKRLLGTESSFNPKAVGAMTPQGQAHGIAQIMTQIHGVPVERAQDPAFAIPFAAQLLAQNLKKANGDYTTALQMYKGAVSEGGKARMAGPIAEILGGGGQTSAAPAQQPVAPQGTPGAVYGGQGDPQALQRQLADTTRQYQYLQERMGIESDDAKRQRILAQMEAVKGAHIAAQTGFAYQTGNLPALVNIANSMGIPVGLQDAGDGQVIAVAQGRQSQPMDRAAAAQWLYGQVDAQQRAADAKRQESYRAAEQSHQFAALLEREKGTQARETEMLKGIKDFEVKAMEAGVKANEIKFERLDNGGVVAVVRGQMYMVPTGKPPGGGADKFGGAVAAPLQPVSFAQ
jgi:soluble lytic murein transglycosylase-like protein